MLRQKHITALCIPRGAQGLWVLKACNKHNLAGLAQLSRPDKSFTSSASNLEWPPLFPAGNSILSFKVSLTGHIPGRWEPKGISLISHKHGFREELRGCWQAPTPGPSSRFPPALQVLQGQLQQTQSKHCLGSTRTKRGVFFDSPWGGVTEEAASAGINPIGVWW